MFDERIPEVFDDRHLAYDPDTVEVFTTVEDSPEVADVRRRVREVVSKHVNASRLAEMDESETYDLELYTALGDAGLLRLEAQPDGTRPRHQSQITVLEELGATATSVAVSLVVQYMGVEMLNTFGTAEQRSTYLEPLLAGEQRMSFALSEPGGGTDVARAMETVAQEQEDGSFVINGRKKWIGAASTADYLLVLARTSDAERSAIDGITVFVVPRSLEGITTRSIDTAGIRGLEQADILLQDVRVPSDAVLGDVGKGFRHVLSTLNGERMNGSAVALGIARGALSHAVAYAQGREAFGRPVGGFQALQHELAEVAVQIEGARHLLNYAAQRSDEESNGANETLSALAKVATSDAGTRASDVGMRVMGGWGFLRQLPMQRFFRDARLYTFAPLTDEMTKNYIAQKHLGLPKSY